MDSRTIEGGHRLYLQGWQPIPSFLPLKKNKTQLVLSLLSQSYRHLLLSSHKMTTLFAPFFFYLAKTVDLSLLKQQTKSHIFLFYTLDPLLLSSKTITKRKKNKTSSPCSFFWISFSFLRLDQERTSLMIFPSSPFCSLGSQPKETLFYSFSLFRKPTSLPWPSWPFIAKASMIAWGLKAELSRWSETNGTWAGKRIREVL